MSNYTHSTSGYSFRYFLISLVAGMLLLPGEVSHAIAGSWTVRAAVAADRPGHSQAGPLADRVKAVDRARATFERATAAGAEYAAPFEYHMAKEYLALAHDEMKEGDRIGVLVFAAKSEVYANLAARKAAGGGR